MFVPARFSLLTMTITPEDFDFHDELRGTGSPNLGILVLTESSRSGSELLMKQHGSIPPSRKMR